MSASITIIVSKALIRDNIYQILNKNLNLKVIERFSLNWSLSCLNWSNSKVKNLRQFDKWNKNRWQSRKSFEFSVRCELYRSKDKRQIGRTLFQISSYLFCRTVLESQMKENYRMGVECLRYQWNEDKKFSHFFCVNFT